MRAAAVVVYHELYLHSASLRLYVRPRVTWSITHPSVREKGFHVRILRAVSVFAPADKLTPQEIQHMHRGVCQDLVLHVQQSVGRDRQFLDGSARLLLQAFRLRRGLFDRDLVFRSGNFKSRISREIGTGHGRDLATATRPSRVRVTIFSRGGAAMAPGPRRTGRDSRQSGFEFANMARASS